MNARLESILAARSLGPRRVALLVALVSLVVFVLTVCPTIYFGDGPELMAAADCLGVAHPPGYPLYTLLGWLALRVPFGETALRMNLLSVLFGALACGAASWLVQRLTGSAVGAATAGLTLAFSSSFWAVATVTEVYAFHLFLTLAVLCGAAVLGDAGSPVTRGRAFAATAAAAGLALAHHPTVVLAFPAAACLALLARRGPRISLRHALLGAFLLLFLPAVLYASMMVRSAAGPPVNWGGPDNLRDLLVHVKALTFRHLDLGWVALGRAAPWLRLGRVLLAEASPLVLVLAALGLATRPLRGRLAVLVLGLASALFGLRYDVPDVEVYYLPLFVAVALASGLGAAWLAGHPRRAVRLVGTGTALAAIVLTAWANGPSRNLRQVDGAALYARDILATVPRNGIVFVESMDSFGLLYLTQVLGERPDVTLYERYGIIFRDLVREFAVPPVRGESWWEHRIRTERTFLEAELSRPDARPILFLGWPGYEVSPRFRIEPLGLLLRVRPVTDPVEDKTALWQSYHEARIREQARKTGDVIAQACAATYALARGEQAMFEGDTPRAAAAFDEAATMAREVAGIHSYIGTVWGRHGDYPRAIQALERAVAIRPSAYQAWNNLALACELAGDREGARRALRRSLALAPGQNDVAERLRRLDR